MAIAENKSERIEIRTTPNMKALLQRAAASSHKNVTEFLLEAGINAAEDALVDRRIFRLDDRQWQAFQAILDRPVADKPRLTRLLAEKSVLERRRDRRGCLQSRSSTQRTMSIPSSAGKSHSIAF